MALSRLRCSAIRRAPYLRRARLITHPSQPHLHPMEIHSVARMSLLRCNPSSEQMLKFCRSEFFPFVNGVHAKSLSNKFPVGIRYYSSSDAPEHAVLHMPALSPTMSQGNITKWRKKAGDKISVGDVLCEIETDKATLEFESLEEGFLGAILVPEGTKDIAVGHPIAITVEDPDDLEKVSKIHIGSETKHETSSVKSTTSSEQANKSTSPKTSLSELPQHIVLVMPALSPTMNQGNLTKWCKKEGDKIDAGDIICEIETDKATLEYESLEEGWLAKILVPEGSKEVAVGQPIAITVEDPEGLEAIRTSDVGDLKSSPDTTIQQSVVKDAEIKGVKYNRISPSALLLLKEHGLDASSITASGPRGTMLKGDVLAAIKSQKGAAKVAHSDDEISPRPIQSQTTSMLKSTVQQTDDYEDLPNTQIRKVIATRLLESKQSIPHLYLSTDVILDPLLAFRKDLKEKHDTKVSVNDIVIKAVAVALRNVPQANAYWDAGKGEIVLCSSVDISVAVATEKGLMTPIVRSADQKSISAISLEIKELAEKARAGKLKPNEFQGGTFSISNLGMFPVDRFCAIINPPQSGILAVGRGNQVVEAVAGEDGIVKPAVVTKMNLTLSADNRVFDGIVGGAFLEALQLNFSDIRRLML